MKNNTQIDINELIKKSKKLSILYLEDEKLLRERTSSVLSRIFTDVDVAVNGKDGLDKYLSKKYDLVLTDILIPKMNGYELIHNILKKNEKQEIIIISALSEEESNSKELRDNDISCINKPVELNQMLNTLNYHVDKLNYYIQ